MGELKLGAGRPGRRRPDAPDRRCSCWTATAELVRAAEPDRRRAGPDGPRVAELTQARGARRAEDDAVLAARARPALAGRGGQARARRAGAGARCPRSAAAFADGRVTAEQVAVIAPVARPENLAAAAEQGVDLAAVDRGAGRDRRHPAARRAQPGGAPLPGPARPRRHRTRPHRGPVAVHRQARRRQRDRPRSSSTPSAGRRCRPRWSRWCRPTGPQGDQRTRAQQLGDALVQWADNALAAGEPADPAHASSRTWS